MDREEKSIVALMGCSHALSHGFLLIYPAVLLLLQKEFSMDYLKLGIIGNVMNLCYGLGALPAGMIYNHLGPKRLYLICFLGSSLAAVFVSLSPTVTLFAAGLALLGVLGSVYHPLGNAVISAKVREYGRAMGIHGAVGNIGLSLAPFLIGLIASRWGWRQAYLIFAVPGIVLSAGSLFVDLSLKREKRSSANNRRRFASYPRRCCNSGKECFSCPLWGLLIPYGRASSPNNSFAQSVSTAPDWWSWTLPAFPP